jgi:hypothetical protein
MEESVIQFYRVHTPIYTQSASYCSIEDHMHALLRAICMLWMSRMRYAITKGVDACGSIEDCMRILHAACDPHAAALVQPSMKFNGVL